MLKLIWRASAQDDLHEIIAYISDRDAAAAERLLAAIEACAETLPQFPFMYRTGRVPGTREAVVHPNYILIYRVTTDAVESSTSCMHAANTPNQRPPENGTDDAFVILTPSPAHTK